LRPASARFTTSAPAATPGEFVFVPAAPDSTEGEGWLMGLVVDLAAEATDLVILDAGRFAAPPIARVRLRHRVSPGFQGNWIAARAAPAAD
jgi:carotenoid cleavage dioxygenase